MDETTVFTTRKAGPFRNDYLYFWKLGYLQEKRLYKQCALANLNNLLKYFKEKTLEVL